MEKKTFNQEEVKLVDKISSIYTLKFNYTVPYHDISQDLFLYMCEERVYRNIKKYRESREFNKIRTLLTRQALAYCLSYVGIKEDTSHYKDTKQNRESYYTEKEIKNSLPYIFEDIEYQPDGKLAEIILDVRNAYYSLNNKDREILELRFNKNLDYTTIGLYLSIDKFAAMGRVKRALQRLDSDINKNPLSLNSIK